MMSSPYVVVLEGCSIPSLWVIYHVFNGLSIVFPLNYLIVILILSLFDDRISASYTWRLRMKLREWRIQKVMTQKELAQRAGVAEVTVAAIERGHQLPSPRTSRRLAEALGIEPTEIDEVKEYIERSLKKDLARVS